MITEDRKDRVMKEGWLTCNEGWRMDDRVGSTAH